MKILSIRGENLASLEKEFEIDFTAEPLKSAGIFAITGCTGSGKSTLLDALCLALFDASPRTSRVTENIAIQDVGDKTINQRDSRNILRRGASDGFAEVDFVSLGGETFRAKWSVRRARNKVDGSMQSSEMRLHNLSTGKEEQGFKTEILTRITELIGLTFDQFTRSVLLAQGDFATFLKARQSEKAELLEKLTGTDIYSRISVAIYENAKNAEAEWNLINERIKGIELLPGEEIKLLETESVTIRQELSALKKDGELLVAQLKWIDDSERIIKEVMLAETKLAAAQNVIKEAAKRFDYIAQSDAVQDIRDTFGVMKDTEKQLAAYRENLQSSETQLEDNAKHLYDAERNLAACEKEQELLSEKQKEIAPQIIKARELDILIKAAKANCDEALKEFNDAKSASDKSEKNVQQLELAVSQTNRQISALNEWFAANKSYESVAPRTELLINLVTDAQMAGKQAEHSKKTLETNRTLLDEHLKQLDVLKQEAEKLNSLLPAEIAALRAGLIEGQPCPVCGSTHHPAAKPEDIRRMKEQELNSAKEKNVKQTERLTNETEKLKNENTRLSALIENYTTQYNHAYGILDIHLPAIPEWKKLFDRADLKDFLTAKTALWNSNTEKLAKMREDINRLHLNLENEKNKQKENVENLNGKKDKLAVHRETEEQLLLERSKALHGKPADAAEQYFAGRQKEISEKVKTAVENKNSLTAKRESLNGILSQIKKNIAQADEKHESLQREINRRIKDTGNITYELLTELLSKDNAWIQREKEALKILAETETEAKATLAERRKNAEQHNRSESKPTGENEMKEHLQKSLAEKNASVENLNNRLTLIGVSLSSDAKAREQIKSLSGELKAKSELSENWKKLNLLLGSASGNKFKEIAQGYTLETLLTYANKHLRELSPRYKLQRIPDTLALQIIDTGMLNEVRTVHSLSGGESFLISLALALGLSSLSSNRMKVESLFIDEGFGSLDNETLRTAMDVLEHLHTQGRKIGVISHVAEMTERISVQINVIRTSNGKSTIKIKK
ncbi:MAG: AAA family ATPase [Tannerella sp.]|jgi:exonuclease SbcC|nr:AAA family ATPase [Tannerella sp.]